jgi:alpha-1,3-rhamnosyl/mannosyltransferase
MLIRLGLATMLIVPTDAVRRQVTELFHIHADRVAVVPDAAPKMFAPGAEPFMRRPYFLFVGTIEPRKNVPEVVSAWRALRSEHDVDLVLAGRRRSDGPEVHAEPGLHVLGEVEESTLPGLYSGAVALVYPSRYEGFGLPVVEAMQCGCAVITSRDAALQEVGAGAAIATDDLYGAMKALLANSEERGRRQQLSVRRAGEFSWSRTAQMTREVYADAVRRFGV